MNKTYVTQAGDMWDSIALSQLGSEFYANQLIDANSSYSDEVKFNAGIKLIIPTLVIDDSKINLPPWARK